jgi:hypothetical protein
LNNLEQGNIFGWFSKSNEQQDEEQSLKNMEFPLNSNPKVVLRTLLVFDSSLFKSLQRFSSIFFIIVPVF